MAKRMELVFPATIFVQHYIDRDADRTFLLANETREAATEAYVGSNEPGERVAIYTLSEVVRLRREVLIHETKTP